MGLTVGIVGLPNVGKSTLFNALTRGHAPAENYPFCTVEPNTGIASIPDPRLETLARLTQAGKVVPASVTFLDIAGLVPGASRGEGLGNTFLSHIREVSVLVHVVRCFHEANVVHVQGRIDPAADLEVVDTELLLADLEACERWLAQLERSTRHGGSPEDRDRSALLTRIREALALGRPVRALGLDAQARAALAGFPFLTLKPVIYVANLGEDQLGRPGPEADAVRAHAARYHDAFAVIGAEAEAEINELPPAEKAEFLQALNIPESGLDAVVRRAFDLLGLQTFLTVESRITRAWTLPRGATALEAAGVIHTDFAKGFIRANVVAYADLVRVGGFKEAREQGVLRQEGREYIMKDGDVVEFLFNV
jgi:ribosome-binding ATPase